MCLKVGINLSNCITLNHTVWARTCYSHMRLFFTVFWIKISGYVQNHYLLRKNFQCLNVAVIKLKLDFSGIVWVCRHCSQGKICASMWALFVLLTCFLAFLSITSHGTLQQQIWFSFCVSWIFLPLKFLLSETYSVVNLLNPVILGNFSISSLCRAEELVNIRNISIWVID